MTEEEIKRCQKSLIVEIEELKTLINNLNPTLEIQYKLKKIESIAKQQQNVLRLAEKVAVRKLKEDGDELYKHLLKVELYKLYKL